MKKKTKIITFLLALIMILFIGLGINNVSAAEIDMSNKITSEVERYVNNGTLPSWHLNYYKDEGYQTYYYKMKYLNNNFTSFKSETQSQIQTHVSWYKNKENEIWYYILDNLDIEPEYLEEDKYLGLYWDSYAYDSKDNGYLYLIWTSPYSPSEFVNILEFKESGKTYKLYDSEEDMENFKSNWYESAYYHFKDYNLTLHISPIGGLERGKYFGIELKQKYKFEGFKYGMDQSNYEIDMDPNNYFNGECKDTIIFDLGVKPKQDGKNAMQLVTHAYEYIKDCEVQSYYDYFFGGMKHMAHFNLTINPDKIYRVDVKYTISNSNKNWYQFWLKDDSHTITKSLTPDKSRGGRFGLFQYQGFKEGSFTSVSNQSKKYKYELFLNYDDKTWLWNIFTGQEYKEAHYKKVDEFKILRINYLLDDEVYDVAIKMDTIEGGTYNIFSKDLIEDENSVQHKIKVWADNLFNKIKDKLDKGKWIIYTILGVIGLSILVIIIIRLKQLMTLLTWKPKDDSGGNDTCKKKDK